MTAILGIVGATGRASLLSDSKVLGKAFVALANILAVLFRVCYDFYDNVTKCGRR